MDVMGYRNIAVPDELYSELARAKRSGESFAALLKRLLAEHRPSGGLDAVRGGWSGMTDAEEKAFFADLKAMWGTWNERIGHGSSGRRASGPTRSRRRD